MTRFHGAPLRPLAVGAAILACLCAPTVLSGCGGDDADATAAAPAVDPRYASAEALCNEINAMVADIQHQGSIGRVREFLGLIHTETALQERFVGMLRNVDPVIELFETAMTRFGGRDQFLQGMREAAQEDGVNWNQPATGRLASNSGRRATVEFTGPDGEVMPLHLVELDNRWWISGYTFEYDPDVKDLMSGPDAPALERFFTSIGREARLLNDQVSSGQLATQEQFGMAMFGAFMKVSAENPEAQTLFERLAEKYGGQGGFGGR